MGMPWGSRWLQPSPAPSRKWSASGSFQRTVIVGEQVIVVWFSLEVEDGFFGCFFGRARWHAGS